MEDKNNSLIFLDSQTEVFGDTQQLKYFIRQLYFRTGLRSIDS